MTPRRGATERVTLRAALPGDIPGVVALERECFSDPWSARAFTEEIDRPTSRFVVACSGRAGEPGQLVGYAIAHVVADEAELANLAVSSTWRGQGIGAMLVREVIDVVRGAGARHLWLEVRASNASARHLYGQLGFDDVGVRRRYYARPVEDAILMRRTLREP